MSKQPKFHIYQDHAGECCWRLKSASGRIIAVSAESYSSKAGAKRAVNTVIDTVMAIVYSDRLAQ